MTAKKLLPQLGRIIAVNGLWTIYTPPEYFEAPSDWRTGKNGGPVLINLIHDVDIMHHLFGPIVRVYAEETVSQRGFEAEEGAAITLKFASGVVGTFVLSDAVASPYSLESGTGENPDIYASGQDFYRILGSDGTLSIPDMTIWSYEKGEKNWAKAIHPQRFDVEDTKVPFELQIEHFVRLIQGREEPSCSGAEGLRALAVCEAVRRSLREQRLVDLDLQQQ